MAKIYGGDEIIIRSMMIQQTGTFHDVYNRAFEMDLDDRALDNIKKRIAGTGGRDSQITSKSFKGISSGILSPVAEIDPRRDLIRIPDGWDRPRCRFMMEMDVKSRFGGTDTYYFQGFSDHLGLTHSGNIDPRMKWFINGYIRVKVMERETRRGIETYGVVKASAQVINGRLVHDPDFRTDLTRTVDLFGNIQTRYMQEGFADEVIDDRTRLNSPADSVFASRADNLPGNYLSSALNTYRRNIDTEQFGTGTQDVLTRTQQELNSEIMLMEDVPFLRQIAQIQGRSCSTEFTIEDLLDVDPDCMRSGAIQGSLLTGRAATQLATHSSDVSDWRGADLESRWAVQMTNALGAIMLANYHRSVDFRISNLNFEHRIVIELFDAMGVAEGLPTEITERMLDAIEDLLFDMSSGGRDDFDLTVKSNLYDQTEIHVSINGSHSQRYFIPSFADSLMTPFYSRDTQVLANLSSDIETLLSDLGGELSGSATAVARGV